MIDKINTEGRMLKELFTKHFNFLTSKNTINVFLLFLVFTSIIGCTDAQPEIKASSSSSGSPTISGKVTNTYTLSNLVSVVSVVGECDGRTKKLQVSFNNGSTWMDAASVVNGASDLSCTDKNFTLNFDFTTVNSYVGFVAGTPATKAILIRAQASFGTTDAAAALINYSGTSLGCLVVTTQPTNTVAGASILYTVTVKDVTCTTTNTSAVGNLTASIASSTASGYTFGGSTSFALAAGVGNFNSTLDKSGTYSLNISYPGYSSVITNSFNILPGVPTTAVILSGNNQNSDEGIIQSLPIIAEVRDAYSNLVGSGYTITTIASTGTATASVTDGLSQTIVNWTLGCVLGAQTVQIKYGATTLNTANATLVIGAVKLLNYFTQPMGNGVPFEDLNISGSPVSVQAKDFCGNITTVSDGSAVNLTLNPGTGGSAASATFSPITTSSANLIGGVATFNHVGITKTGSNYTIQASSAIGGVTSAVSSPINIELVIKPFYLAAANFNDYLTVNNDEISSMYSTVGVDCLAPAPDFTTTKCINAGAVKKVSTESTVCSPSITFGDFLAAFEWDCFIDPLNGNAVYRGRLKLTSGLANLLNLTPSWKTDYISFTGGSTGTWAFTNSSPQTLWSNPVVNYTGTPTLISSPSDNGKVFVVTSNLSSTGLQITSTKVSLVVMPNLTMTATSPAANCSLTAGAYALGGTEKCLLAISGDFSYVEGQFSGNLLTDANILSTANFNHFNNISTFSTNSGSTYGFGLILAKNTLMTSGNRLSYVKSSNHKTGIKTYKTQNAYLYVTNLFNNNFGMNLDGANQYVSTSIMQNLSLVGLVSNVSNSIFNNLTITNANIGINEANSSTITNNIFNNVMMVNVGGGGGNGINSSAGSNVNDFYSNVSLSNGGTGAVGVYLNTGNYQFAGKLQIGNYTTANCSVTSATGMSNGSSCTGSGASLILNNSTVNITSTSVIGPVTSDIINTHGSTFSYAGITDWTKFSNWFRGWGMNLGLNSISARKCTTGTCQVWDFTLKLTDQVSLNRSVVGAGIPSNSAFVPLSACPSQLDGNQTYSFNTLTWQQHSFEPMFSGRGNDNGLCESGEICVYSPNFGAYQGHVVTGLNYCLFNQAGGPISNAFMIAFDGNGY